MKSKNVTRGARTRKKKGGEGALTMNFEEKTESKNHINQGGEN